MTDQAKHKSVLLKEVLQYLDIKKGDVYFDGTLGLAGHAKEICKKSIKALIATDLDKDSIEVAKENLKSCCRTTECFIFNTGFENIDQILPQTEYSKVDKILLDLGWNSFQFEHSGKGFSFMKDEPLVMLYSDKGDFTAYDIVNFWRQENIEAILKGFGEERYAKKIAEAIVKAREKGEIKSTKELVEIIKEAVPAKYQRSRIHFATKTFQALRIAVNKELERLQEALDKMEGFLQEGGRLAVISFHSLEDRIVKRKFKEWVSKSKGVLVNKKPIVASKEELEENPRARSAKLRVYEKIK